MLGRAQIIVPKRRTGHSKAKTGCVTCKYGLVVLFWHILANPFRKRHVKCDEEKPNCNKCLKLGLYCEGYRIKSNNESRVRAIIPKAPSQFIYSPSTHMFTNDQEKYCYRIFCDKTSSQLSGCFDSSLWSRMILQACETDPAIRHAVVAIGALDFTLGISHGRPLLSSSGILESNHEEAEKHHRFALRQYGAAIREMRLLISKEKPDIRRTLLGCLVIACFEALHGNFPSAIAQVQSGLALLEEWQFRNQSNSKEQELLGISSTLPNTIEDELHQALCRLDIQLLSFVDIRPFETHKRMRQYGFASLNNMPSRFQTLRDARIYLEIVMRRIMHFRAYISPTSDYTGLLRISPQKQDANQPAFAEQQTLILELTRWHDAFAPLQSTTSSLPTSTKENINIATMLQIHY